MTDHASEQGGNRQIELFAHGSLVSVALSRRAPRFGSDSMMMIMERVTLVY